MLLTLSEARDSDLKNISGCCPDTDNFLLKLNTATRRLMRRGDWPGTIVPIMTCVYGGCIVWPRYVGSVRKLNVCNQPISVQSAHTQFLQYDSPNWGTGRNWWGTNYWGSWLGNALPTTGPNGCGMPYMMDQGKSPVFQDIMGDNRLVRAYFTVQADLGKTVTIFGTDNSGLTLATKQTDGTWRDGWVITLASLFGSTAGFVRHIDRVLLDPMEGVVRLYAYNTDTSLLEDIGTYEPGDTNPAFERYKLDLRQCGCSCLQSVVALVKLKFIEARYDNDLVLIENIDALKLMIQSIIAAESNSMGLAQELEAAAIRELNLQLADASPLDQMPVSVSSFGTSSFRGQRMF